MTDALAISLAAILGAVGALHAHWAFGGLWPAGDEGALARTVVGAPGRRRMPPAALTLAVVACLAGAAAVAILLRWPGSVPTPVVLAAGGMLALVFLVRGAAGFTRPWRRLHPVEPFARLDRLVYSPLCLALGLAFLALVLARQVNP